MSRDEKRSDEAEWGRLADAASPGPWVLDSHAHGASHCRCMSCYQTSTVWQPGGRFCDDVPRDENDPDDDGDRCDQFGYSYEDAAFIAAARTAVPSLLAALAAAREDNDRLRKLVEDQLGECVGCNYNDGPDEYCPHHGRSYNDVLDVTERIITKERADLAAARVEVTQLQARIDRVMDYCNEADRDASRGKIGAVVLPWAGSVRYLLGAAGPESPSVVPEMVGRIQYALRQIGEALRDSRIDPAAAAWLRTIGDGLGNASGDVLAEPLGSTEDPPATEEKP